MRLRVADEMCKLEGVEWSQEEQRRGKGSIAEKGRQ
jgi:hypothetical protein